MQKKGKGPRHIPWNGLLWGLVVVLSVLLVAWQPLDDVDMLDANGPIVNLAGDWRSDGARCTVMLPEDLPNGSVLEFVSPRDSVEVSVDGQTIYAASESGAVTAVLWVPLPDGSAGKMLMITGQGNAAARLARLNAASSVGSGAALQRRLFADNFYALVFSLFALITAGFLAYVSFRSWHRKLRETTYSVGALSLFILCSGIWVLTDSPLLQFVSNDGSSVAMISVATFLFMPILFLRFLKSMLPGKCLFNILGCFFLSAMAVGLILHLTGLLSIYDSIGVYHLMILAMFLLVTIAFARQNHPQHRLIQIGCLLYFLLEVLGLWLYHLIPTSRLYAAVICFGIFALGTSCMITWFDEYLGNVGRLAQNELLQKLAFLDDLTGVLNRSAFDRDCKTIAEQSDITFVMFDINGLKSTNDTWGHVIGDQLIQSAAKLITDTFQPVGTVYRIGGDEFVAILQGASETTTAELLQTFAERMQGQTIDHAIPVRIAYGAASTREVDVTAANLLQHADQRMYARKKAMKQAEAAGIVGGHD